MCRKILSNLECGEKGKIIKIRGRAGIHQYLYKLGVIVGCAVRMEKTGLASQERPIEVWANGNVFSLEKDIAENIKVELV